MQVVKATFRASEVEGGEGRRGRVLSGLRPSPTPIPYNTAYAYMLFS